MSNPAELTTPENLTDEAIAAFRANGFAHLPKVLTDEEVAECLRDAEEWLSRGQKMAWDKTVDPSVVDGTVMEWVDNPESAVLRRLALHPRITAIAEKLTGNKLRMFRSEIVRKPHDKSSVTPPHIDAPYWPWKSGADRGAYGASLTAWVALTDVPVERGCMSFVPGSHIGPEPTTDDWDIFTTRPELAWQPRIVVPLRAGGMTFHHERVVHMAGANLTQQDRVSLGTVYIDADTVFDPEYGTAEEDLGVQPGQRLDTERYPLVADFQ
ncbi:phytanoyl-CoA dioxygenase family protein [Kibdelosporangium persicum]|uniref:Phytanoyl-CoA dioxygenase PhyH n=1 Tax=Kibdelosporangium persicum TaxID=2698649 RepID=A0ABX2EW76_9PSEU|nr:phytanoyl-CoA dioxygenase family protein [Kibdelosporangium persicum]NRN63222.1 Phytanoyl-CoA dioxygenase PhyH [Kibdelosporangium persicum]